MTDQNPTNRNEKEDEKEDEKSPEEKSWDEKWSRDPVSAGAWAAIFIWAGLVMLANNLGMLDRLASRFSESRPWSFIGRLEAWGIILVGAGVIVLLEVLVRLVKPEYRRPISGNIFLAVCLIGIGLGELFGWQVIWPLILIALGLSVLIRGFLRSR